MPFSRDETIEFLDSELMHGKSSSSSSSSGHLRPDNSERIAVQHAALAAFKQPQSRGWVFTLNNHNSVDAPRVFADTASYCVWQEERGESGTPHLQGYLYFSTGPRRLSSLKALLPSAHFEPRRGSHDQARDYVTKDDTRISGPYEYGTEPVATGQGARSDLVSLKRALDDDRPLSEVWDEHFNTMIKYHKGASEYKRVKQMANPRDFKTVCFALFGPTSGGKSYAARANFPKAYWPSKPAAKQPFYFDGYDGRAPIVLDEFYGWIPYDLLLRLCDNTPLMLPTKGGFVGVAPVAIVFTSNKSPEQWYNYQHFQGGYAPLERRLDVIIEIRSRTEQNVWKQPNGQTEVSVSPGQNDFRSRFKELFTPQGSCP